MDWITNPEHWIALITLVVLELVLGVDNIIFISILVGKLPQERQNLARTLGISLAVGTRILLLLFLSWVIGLTAPIFSPFGHDFSGRDLILLGGGLFLLWKSTREIHEKLEGVEGQASARVTASFWGVIIEIMLLDIVFSLDSVITAVGMSGEIAIMIIAVVIAAGIMIFVSKPIGDFVEHHPTVKMLALSFLLMIGFTLVAGGFGVEIPKGYIYFAMAFSVFVEMLNLRMRKKEVRPVNLRDPYKPDKKPYMSLAAEGANPTAEGPVKTSKPTASKPKKNNTSNRKKKK